MRPKRDGATGFREGSAAGGTQKTATKRGGCPLVMRKRPNPHRHTIPTPMPDTAPPKPQIAFEDLTRIDIRVGTILEVSDIPNSRKRVRLTVDLGFATRTVVVGMKQERRNPSEAADRQALFVVNLPPRKLAGVLSQAMLFDLGIPTASRRRWPSRNAPSPTERAPVEPQPNETH